MSDFWSKNTVCLITGASQSIGKAISELLATKLGPNSLLIMSSRSKERLELVKQEAFNNNPGLAVELIQWDFKHPNAEIFKADLVQASLRDAGGPGGFEQAIIIHNAASLGDMGQKVTNMRAGTDLYDSLNINLVSMLTLNSVFLEVFAGVPKGFSVNCVTFARKLASLVRVRKEISDGRAMDTVRFALRSHSPAIRNFLPGSYERSELSMSEALPLRILWKIPKRTIVNMTAPSAVKPRPSFGMTSMTKSSRQILLSILAKEEKDVKVLHFDPVAVDSESLRAIKDSAHDPDIRQWIQGFYNRGEVLAATTVAKALASVLAKDEFQSGDITDAITAGEA